MVTNREELENIKNLPVEANHTQVRLLIIIADELIKVNHYFESERLRSLSANIMGLEGMSRRI